MQDSSSNNNNLNSKSELWNLSLRDIFYKYVRFLPVFIFSVAFMLLIAYLYLRYSIPEYSVGGSMLIKSEQAAPRNESGLEALMNPNQNSNIPTEMEILRSVPLMKRVVDSLHLQFSYAAKGKIKTVNIYKQGPFTAEAFEINDSLSTFTLKIKFRNDQQFVINDDPKLVSFGQVFKTADGVFRLNRNPSVPIANNDYSVTWQPTMVAAAGYAGAIQVGVKTAGTGILNVSMRTTNSAMGADIINKLMAEYEQYTLEQKNISSLQKLQFINERLADLTYRIDSQQQILNVYEKQNDLIDAVRQSEIIFGKVGDVDKDINQQTLQYDLTGILTDYLSRKDKQYEKVPITLNIQDITLTQLVTDYNTAQVQRQMLLDANVPVNNPAVLEAGDKIEKLRTSLQENLRNIRNSISSSIGTLRSRSSRTKVELSSLPEKTKEQLKMYEEIQSLKGLQKIFREERERQGIVKAANTANSNIINNAYPSSRPVKPNRRGIQMLAILLGLGIPALVIFLREIFNDKVSTRFDVEKITLAPILGEIGHSYSDNVMVVSKTTRSMVAEQFRIIRSNLQYVLHKKDKSTILITSSFSGEGKSYVSTNMGAVLALAGKKTIILEFDIRKPKILSGLGLPKAAGITNYLIGKAELKDIVRQVPNHENLYVLGCGPIPPNPSELLLDERVDSMFAWLKENFDVVLIDTAPVGMVSDAMTLGKYADVTLYLVRQNHTFKKQIAFIDEFYKEEKLPRVSIIINDVKVKAGYGYYGYGRYGYGYGYGYGTYYEEETPPQNFLEKMLDNISIGKFFKKKKKDKGDF